MLVEVSEKPMRKSEASTPAAAKSKVIVLEFVPVGSVAARTVAEVP